MEPNAYNSNNPPIQSNPYELAQPNNFTNSPQFQSNPINQPYVNQPYLNNLPYPIQPTYNQPPPFLQPPPYPQAIPYSQPPIYGQPAPNRNPIIYQVNFDQEAPCPLCGKNASKIPIQETSTTQWIWCFVLFLLCWPCCWVPCVMDKCNDVRYQCSNCRSVRYRYRAPCCP